MLLRADSCQSADRASTVGIGARNHDMKLAQPNTKHRGVFVHACHHQAQARQAHWPTESAMSFDISCVRLVQFTKRSVTGCESVSLTEVVILDTNLNLSAGHGCVSSSVVG